MLHVFAIVSICFFVWFCGFVKAQASPIHAGAGNTINTGSSTNQQTGQSENQIRPSGRKSECQRIPKLERNRLEEGKKSVPVRKRKKSHKSNKTKTAKKKRKANILSNEDTTHITSKKKKDQKVNITTERVDDIPLLIKAMLKMGIQQAIDQHVTTQKNQRDLSWGWTAVIWLA